MAARGYEDCSAAGVGRCSRPPASKSATVEDKLERHSFGHEHRKIGSDFVES